MSAVEGLVTYHVLPSTEERERETRGKSGVLRKWKRDKKSLFNNCGGRNLQPKCNQITNFVFSVSEPIIRTESPGGGGSAAFMTEALISAAVGSKSEGLPKSGLWKALSASNQLKAADIHQSPALDFSSHWQQKDFKSARLSSFLSGCLSFLQLFLQFLM